MTDDQTKTCPMCGAFFGTDASRCVACGESFSLPARPEHVDQTRSILIASAGCCFAITGICGVLKIFTPLLSNIPWSILTVGPAVSFSGIFVVLAGINLIAKHVR